MSVEQADKERFLAVIARLIRIPSRSSPTGGEEGAIQAEVAAAMRRLGARVRAFDADEVPGFRAHPLCHGPERDYAGRPTVVGEIGPEGAPALLVLAHSDTVPVNRPGEWTVNPFAGVVRGGRLVGLGAGDDKWGVAAMLSIMESLQRPARSAPLRKRVIFASTIDEEHGVGNGTLLLMLAGVRAEAALYLDGADFNVGIGCNGGSHLALRPKRPIAPERRARHARRLADAAAELSRRRTALYDQPYFRDNAIRAASVKLFERGEGASFAFLMCFYNPPGEDPAACRRDLESAVAATLGEEAGDYNKSYRRPWFEPALVSEQTPIARHLKAAVAEVTGQPARVSTISKQDSFVLTNHARIPTVSFGVAPTMDPGGYHAPDEGIDVAEAWSGLRAAEGAVRRWLEDFP